MKKIEILIREVKLDDKVQEIEHKTFRTKVVEDDANFDIMLPCLLDECWDDIKGYYLRNRHAHSFRPIRRGNEKTSED